MGWNEERVAVLKSLWQEGLSASQIAKQLGGGVTRNAVIGKVHRLGLAGRATPSRPPKRTIRVQARPRPSTPSLPVPRAPRPTSPPQLSLAPALPQLEPLRNEDGRTTTVLELTDRVCKWPIGDPSDANFGFCGRPRCAGSYCADHSRQAVQQPQPKKKKVYGEPDELRRMMRLSAM